MVWEGRSAPTAADIEALALAAREGLPAAFRDPLREVRVRVEEWADEETLAEMGIEDAYDLTGLYRGVALTERSVQDFGDLPPEIVLYRRAILDEWADREEVSLGALVTHILVHEAAHHFGWSDDDIARIDRWWE